MIYEPLNRPITILSLGYYVHHLSWQNILCSNLKLARLCPIARLPQLTLTCRAYRRKTINRQTHIRDKHTTNKAENKAKVWQKAAAAAMRLYSVSVQCFPIVSRHHARAHLLKTKSELEFQTESKHVPTALLPLPCRVCRLQTATGAGSEAGNVELWSVRVWGSMQMQLNSLNDPR